MKKKMVSCLVCVIENDVVSADFFNSLDEAYSELDRQSEDESARLKDEGCGPDGVTLIKEPESRRIVWQFNPDQLRAEDPDISDSELESLCRVNETVFYVLSGPLQ